MPPLSPEQRARQTIDVELEAAGWVVQDYRESITAPRSSKAPTKVSSFPRKPSSPNPEIAIRSSNLANSSSPATSKSVVRTSRAAGSTRNPLHRIRRTCRNCRRGGRGHAWEFCSIASFPTGTSQRLLTETFHGSRFRIFPKLQQYETPVLSSVSVKTT